jgi:hypothetical protein
MAPAKPTNGRWCVFSTDAPPVTRMDAEKANKFLLQQNSQ